MEDHLDSVKGYVRLMERWRDNAEAKGEATAVTNYDNRIGFFGALIDEVEELRRFTKPIPASYGDLSDLPPELMKELSGVKVDDLEQQIYMIVKSGGDNVDLDAVLIELFRRFKVVQTRKFLQNKLWRMAQKELIFSVPSRKGVYSATKPKEESGGGNSGANSFADYRATSTPVTGRGGFADDLDDDVPF